MFIDDVATWRQSNLTIRGIGGRARMISFGAEGYRWPRNELFMVNNTLVDDLPRGGDFLRVYPGADRVLVHNNLLLGNARLNLDPQWELSPGALQSVAP